MKINSLEQLFHALLSDIYFVEVTLTKAMPEMEKKAQSTELKEAIRTHLSETKDQVTRLERIFNLLGLKPTNVDWLGSMHLLFENARKFLAENTPSPACDATMIVIAQRIEHFEIATYGTLREFAEVLGYDEVSSILEETLKEEAHADTLLNKLAKGGIFSEGINVKARRT